MSPPLDQLPSVREHLEGHQLWADKKLGQHFLLDLNITRKIVRAAGDLTGRVVVEVGPGPGGLTRALLETDVTGVLAIEKDTRVLPLLAEISALDNRLQTLSADALAVDVVAEAQSRFGDVPVHVIANLPYNVGTPMLIAWLKQIQDLEALTLMFQLEVAERIVAEPGQKAYGRLAVLAQAVADCHMAFRLPAQAFTPPPKVDSAVVNLRPKSDCLAPETLKCLETVTAAAFGQRRKMLRQSLKSVPGPLSGEALCTAAGLPPTARAEEIDIKGFLRLVAAISDQ